MTDSPKVLIAGAGRRVSGAVVPALLALGLPGRDITILRNRAEKGEGCLSGIPTINDLAELSKTIDLTINCVRADALVQVENRLIDKFPRAVHFCDTPIFRRVSELPDVWRLARKQNLFSLEDWPSMPNLLPLFDLCSRSPAYELRFEHIGIPAHFFAAARTAASAAGLNPMRFVIQKRGSIVDQPIRSRSRCIKKGSKDIARSKVAAWNGQDLIEDFLEIQTSILPQNESEEVVVRTFAGDTVSYFVGEKRCYQEIVPAAIVSSILGTGTRERVHDLDKVIAVMKILKRALEGKPAAYSYWHAAQDSIAARILHRTKVACLW